MVSCSKWNAHTEPLYKSLNLLKVEDIFKIKALKFYYKYSQKKHYQFILKGELWDVFCEFNFWLRYIPVVAVL